MAQSRVMVVEDEFLIRLTLVEALSDEGFDVVEAESGDAALPVLQSDPSIKILLTDIQLPGRLDGTQLARRARETRPTLPVLFMTGRMDPTAEPDASPLDSFIAKPYTLTDICNAVRRLTEPAQ
jgi:CheY-like chemotaxis protein